MKVYQYTIWLLVLPLRYMFPIITMTPRLYSIECQNRPYGFFSREQTDTCLLLKMIRNLTGHILMTLANSEATITDSRFGETALRQQMMVDLQSNL